MEFGGSQVGEVGDGAEGADEDVTWEEGFEVYEAVSEGGFVEDLCGKSSVSYGSRGGGGAEAEGGRKDVLEKLR